MTAGVDAAVYYVSTLKYVNTPSLLIFYSPSTVDVIHFMSLLMSSNQRRRHRTRPFDQAEEENVQECQNFAFINNSTGIIELILYLV
jgi:hypothetical protein